MEKQVLAFKRPFYPCTELVILGVLNYVVSAADVQKTREGDHVC
jgi:hypothetical protein